VHDDGSDHDRGAGEEAENLVAEADAENGDGFGQQFEEIQAEAGFFGNAGAGGQDDLVERAAFGQIQNLRVVVFQDERIFAEALEALNEVVCEGVVVID